jgi:hypothetical protein
MIKSSSHATEQRENVKNRIIDSRKKAGRIRCETGSPVSHSV